MPLSIETYSNVSGGNAFFKAVSHPLAAERTQALLQRLRERGKVAIYDPLNQASAFDQIHDLSSIELSDYFIQDLAHIGNRRGPHAASPITELRSTTARQLFITAFDETRFLRHIRHLLPAEIEISSFDAIKLPDAMLSDHQRYLAPLNFATNFAFFRDERGHHTRLVTVNYWAGYGAEDPALWCRLYDGHGGILAEWSERLGSERRAVVLDSGEIRTRFGLPEFTGQLCIHATGIAGHDVVKYALDTYGEAAHVLSCTHDANAWPADFYAGLPAPDEGEEVVLWVQNSLPATIPAGEIRIHPMGREQPFATAPAIPPFATFRLEIGKMLPNVKWPAQFEIAAGRYFVRPRYEIFKSDGRQRISHVNVERTDLKPDPLFSKLRGLLGKGYILPAPILPTDRYTSVVLPTPMATGQEHLPIMATIYDARGEQVLTHRLGKLPRDHATLLDVGACLRQSGKHLPTGYGHVELIYDFDAAEEADGWLHALLRYVDKRSGHVAESSFGSHLFNTVLTYRNEPQSYAGPAPGLSTQIFLRIGPEPYDSFCHLIYPASTPWHAKSETSLTLFDRSGTRVAQIQIAIPCSGSLLWRVSEMFTRDQRSAAGNDSYVIVRDPSCRLFGYHGLLRSDEAFSLDHMFGF